MSRTLAALLGSVPVALGLGMVLARVLPVSLSKRYLIGNFSVFPAWVALCLWVLLASNARRAWLGLVVVAALLVVVLSLAGPSNAVPTVAVPSVAVPIAEPSGAGSLRSGAP